MKKKNGNKAWVSGKYMQRRDDMYLTSSIPTKVGGL